MNREETENDEARVTHLTLCDHC